MNNFTFYNNYFEIVRYLKSEDRLSMYDAIFNYMFEDKEPNFEGIKKGIWVNIKMPLDNSKTNYNNGKKGGRPKSESKTEEKPKQKYRYGFNGFCNIAFRNGRYGKRHGTISRYAAIYKYTCCI